MALDYYALLEVSPLASQREIREAYKKAALKTHPDRVSHSDPTRAARTQKFQHVNDAYYTLSDPNRRRAYDATRPSQGDGGGGFFSTGQNRPESWGEDQFSDIFEEMMRDEGLAEDSENRVTPNSKFWGILGGISGGVMGFIVANVPGLLAGAVAGNRLGAIRDTKGKSVYEVFKDLPQGDRAKVGLKLLLSASLVGGAILFGGVGGRLTSAAAISCLVIWRRRFWPMLLARLRWNIRVSRRDSG